MARTRSITGDPYAEQARVATEAIEFYRRNYIRCRAVFGFKRTHFHDTDVRGPEAAPRYFTNCCNCGASRTAHECSYCKSVTP